MYGFWIFLFAGCLAQLITCRKKPHIIFILVDDFAVRGITSKNKPYNMAVCLALILLILILIIEERCIKSPPHLIFVLADDLGWNDVGFRNPDIKTPNIDDAANNGIILNSSYVQPVCTPSRAALMTGYYPFRTGMQTGVITFFAQYGLPLQFKLLPEALKDHGYSTHVVGKWHLGSCNPKYFPINRGFDSFYGFLGGAGHYFTHSYPLTDDTRAFSGPEFPEVYDFWNQTTPALNYNGTYSSIPFVAQVKSILSNSKPNKPLFLYLPFQTTHTPIEVKNNYSQYYSHMPNRYRRKYSALVTQMDDDFGQVIKLLKQYKFYDNSIVFFSADNGGEVRAGGNNYPLNGAKATPYEGGTRTSAFVHSPLLKNKGYTYNGLIHIVDWYPTLVALAGGKTDADMDGVNVWPSIVNNTSSPRYEFIYILNLAGDNVTGAIRSGKWKLIVGDAGLPNRPVKPDDVTGALFDAVGGAFSSDPNSTYIKLYNLKDDPYESSNLASSRPEVVARLKYKMDKYKRKMAVPLFVPDNIPLYKQMTPDLSILNTNWCNATETVTIIPHKCDN